jgi:AcrR family transcriptional regulator
MPKDRRREQLLDVAMEIVRDSGANELTLGNLAAKAGVSRPIAYGHFETRTGLLLALFKRLEDNYVSALRGALQAAPHALSEVADLISNAYFNCLTDFGPEGLAISAALKGTDEMAAQQRTMHQEYLELMCNALRPFSKLGQDHLRLICVGLLGAAEALASEAQTIQADAIAMALFSDLIEKSISDHCSARSPTDRVINPV